MHLPPGQRYLGNGANLEELLFLILWTWPRFYVNSGPTFLPRTPTPGTPATLSAVKSGTHSSLPEGFKGGREIRDTYPLFYFRSVISFWRIFDSHSPGGRGGERYFRGLAPLGFADVLLRGPAPLELSVSDLVTMITRRETLY